VEAHNLVNEKKDLSHQKKTILANYLPAYLYRVVMWFVQYINVNLNITIPGLAQKDTLGHYVVMDAGQHGIQMSYSPLNPSMQHLGMTTMGALRKMPVVVDGELKIQQVMQTTNTGDHRYGDASIFLPL
jgi:pyruvate/2-oxoglutarate dehydrogenase complex dihydrolipoamide acyltransferase (E2) component